MSTRLAPVSPLAVQSVVAARRDIDHYQRSLIEQTSVKIADLEERLLKARTRLDDVETDPPDEHPRAKEIAERLGLHGQAYDHGLASHSHIRSLRRRVTLLSRDLEQMLRFKEAVEAGHLPMPRLPAVRLEFANVIPVEALESLKTAAVSGLFDEFRIIDGREADRYGTPVRQGRGIRPDPVLVGLIGDELFPLAWWR